MEMGQYFSSAERTVKPEFYIKQKYPSEVTRRPRHSFKDEEKLNKICCWQTYPKKIANSS